MNGGNFYYSLNKNLNSNLIKIIQLYLLPKVDKNKNLDLFRRINILYFIDELLKKDDLYFSLLEKLEFCNEDYDDCKCDLIYEKNIKNNIKDKYHDIFHAKIFYTSDLNITNNMPKWVFDYENKNDYCSSNECNLFYKKD